MKGTFFAKPLEWNIETAGEVWQQGDVLKGTCRIKNHGSEEVKLSDAGVGLAFSDIKKVQTRSEDALKAQEKVCFEVSSIAPGSEVQMDFSFALSVNGPVSDKKSSYYLCFGKNLSEGQLQLKIEPKSLYSKIVGLLDTFHRFKMKEYKTTKKGVEFKLLPPSARDMANVESLLLTFSMEQDNLLMRYDFQVKRLDTSGITTKINKDSVQVQKVLTPKEYSMGKDLINQDSLLKSMDGALAEVRMKAVF